MKRPPANAGGHIFCLFYSVARADFDLTEEAKDMFQLHAGPRYFDCVLFVDLIGKIYIEVRDVRAKIRAGNVTYD